MQAGYRTDPRKLAAEKKSRKAAVRNSKLDKVLYGVDVETNFDTPSDKKKASKTITVGTQTEDSDTATTAATTAATTVSSSMAPTVSSSTTPNYRLLRPSPISPTSSYATVSPVSSSVSFPTISPTSSVSSTGSYKDNAPPAISISAPPEIITAADIGDRTRATSMQNDALMADLRKFIQTDIITPMADSAVDAYATKIQRNLRAAKKNKEFRENLNRAREVIKKSAEEDRDITTIPSNLEETKPLEPAKVPEPIEIKTQPVSKIEQAPPILQELTPSEADTDILSSIAGSPDDMPPLIEEKPKGTDAWKEDVQKAADKFMAAFKNMLVDKGYKNQSSTRITLFDNNGKPTTKRLIIQEHKPNDTQTYRWKFTTPKPSMNFMIDNYPQYDLKKSLEMAIPNLQNYNPTVGQINGLGLDQQEETSIELKSPKVVFATRRGDPGVAPGQLYVMYPQLVRGNVRLYNRSAKTLVTKDMASDGFLRIVRDIVNKNTFDPRDMAEITDPKESALVNKFIMHTKPIMPSGLDATINVDQIKQLKKRYEVLVGLLAGGNHGKLVRDEMIEILRSLMRMGAMAPRKAEKIIKELREF